MERRWVWVAALPMAGAAVFVGATGIGSDEADEPMRAFCERAKDGQQDLVEAGATRAEALAALAQEAPAQIRDTVMLAAAEVDDAAPDVFVARGDPESGVRVDAVMEELARRSGAVQGWDGVVQVLREDCDLELED